MRSACPAAPAQARLRRRRARLRALCRPRTSTRRRSQPSPRYACLAFFVRSCSGPLDNCCCAWPPAPGHGDADWARIDLCTSVMMLGRSCEPLYQTNNPWRTLCLSVSDQSGTALFLSPAAICRASLQRQDVKKRRLHPHTCWDFSVEAGLLGGAAGGHDEEGLAEGQGG